MEEKQEAYFTVSLDLLAGIFDFPIGTRIERVVQTHEDVASKSLTFVISHHLLPKTTPGQKLPKIEIEYERVCATRFVKWRKDE